MMDNNVRIRYIGRTHELPPEVQDKMQWAAEATAHNTGTTLTLALNYGATVGDRRCLSRALAGVEAKGLKRGSRHRRRRPSPSLHSAYARSGSPDSHLRRDADFQLSAVADRLRRDIRHRALLAGFSRDPSAGGRLRPISAANAAMAALAKRSAKVRGKSPPMNNM